MISLFKPKFTVEQIHAEFDAAQEKVLNEADDLLRELQIPTEGQLEKKAVMLEALGFTGSEPVKQYETFKKNQAELQQKARMTEEVAHTIRELSMNYPNEKFITIAELERICSKYGLIHAPVTNYKKDVPEKNVKEIAKRKELNNEHKSIPKNYICWDWDESWPNGNDSWASTSELKILENQVGRRMQIEEYEKECGKLKIPWLIIRSKWQMNDFIKAKTNFNKSYLVRNVWIETVDKSGLFIAAPKSHFNLEGLSKKSKFGFFNVERFEVKDPVVFEYCKNDIVRIISKWGTEDDQSYLDAGLVNEKMN